MIRQRSHHEDPEWIVADRSEIEAVEMPHFSRGYWSRTLDYLSILSPEQAVKLPFPTGVPNGIASSIYRAAARKRMRISLHIRPSAVYICKNGLAENTLNFPRPSKRYCIVCGAHINPKTGTGKQLVCAGTKKAKSECQKVWRYARERRLSVEEAIQRRAIEGGRTRKTGNKER